MVYDDISDDIEVLYAIYS